jgi:hypothetical protein
MKLRNQGKIKNSTSAGTNAPIATETALDKIKRQNRKNDYKDRISEKLGNKENIFKEFGREEGENKPKLNSAETLDNDVPTEYVLDQDELDMLEAVERALDAKSARNSMATDSGSQARIVDEMEELAEKMEKEQKSKLDSSRKVTEERATKL